MLSHIRHRLDRLASSDLDPGRTATAIALGVFLSFSPFLGLQILIGLGAAFAFRLSRVAVLLGLCANLPWIMVPWYALTTAAAAAALGPAGLADIQAGLSELLRVPVYQPAFWSRSGTIASSFIWPFLLGPTIGAAMLSAAAYAISFRMLQQRQQILARAAAERGAPASEPLAGDAEQRASDRHVDDAQRARLQP